MTGNDIVRIFYARAAELPDNASWKDIFEGTKAFARKTHAQRLGVPEDHTAVNMLVTFDPKLQEIQRIMERIPFEAQATAF